MRSILAAAGVGLTDSAAADVASAATAPSKSDRRETGESPPAGRGSKFQGVGAGGGGGGGGWGWDGCAGEMGGQVGWGRGGGGTGVAKKSWCSS